MIDRDTRRLRFDPPRPSHNGGIVPVLALPSRILVKSKSSSFRSCPTNTLVPEVTVTGRAVLARIVRQGTPKYVVSSWIPPESVITTAARCCRARNSMYGNGSSKCSFSTVRPEIGDALACPRMHRKNDAELLIHLLKRFENASQTLAVVDI